MTSKRELKSYTIFFRALQILDELGGIVTCIIATNQDQHFGSAWNDYLIFRARVWETEITGGPVGDLLLNTSPGGGFLTIEMKREE